jgi:NAD(P)-dependent dehydrogenase (short-subunit alcohol dehydrogenase family)
MPQKRFALVTGANRGIGLSIVKGLAARADVHVIAAARRLEDAETVVKAITAKTSAAALDLSSPDTRHEQIAAILAMHPQIDILVNNAGVLENGSLLDLHEAELQTTIEVNFLAALDLVRAIAPGMVTRGYGRIVNLSSGWGSFDEGLNGPPSYAMTKAALNALTLSLSHELRENVKVNSCCPGWVRTRMGGANATRSPDHGAETPIWLATLPDNGPSGLFFRDKTQINW